MYSHLNFAKLFSRIIFKTIEHKNPFNSSLQLQESYHSIIFHIIMRCIEKGPKGSTPWNQDVRDYPFNRKNFPKKLRFCTP